MAVVSQATPYDGRHTFISLLLHEGRSVPLVSAMVGHASARMTLERYAHVYESALHAERVPMAEAVRAARVRVAQLHGVCTTGAVAVLRAVS